MDIENKVAIVTGAAGGIGAAIAQRLLEAGASVVISDLDADRLHETRDRLAKLATPDAVVAVAGDAADSETIAQLISAADEHLGPVDLYFANAGVGDSSGLDADDARWQQALEVNVLAHVRAARQLVPSWLERGSGYFVSTASAAGLLTQLGSATYSVSKSGAVAFSEWLAVTYGGQGIGVSCLCPMGVDTNMLRGGSDQDEGGFATRETTSAVTSAGEVLDPLVVADDVLQAVADETFLILPHESVREFRRRKVADPDRWIRGMQRYATSLAD